MIHFSKAKLTKIAACPIANLSHFQIFKSI